MPKVTSTATRRRSFSPAFKLPKKKLCKIIDNVHNYAISIIAKEAGIIESDYSAQDTEKERKFLFDFFKLGKKSKRTSDTSSSSFSLSLDTCSSSDDEDGVSTVSHEDSVEEPLAASVQVLPSDAPSVKSPPSGSTSDVAAQATAGEETEPGIEKESATLVDLDCKHQTAIPEKKAASRKKERSSGNGGCSSADHLVATATTTATTPVLAPASTAPAPAPALASAAPAIAPSASVPAPSPPGPVPASASASDSINPVPTPSTTPAFPFNHFPPAPHHPVGIPRGLRREHAFYHRSHYEVGWTPEFGPFDAPPQTLEGVLPPWDPSFTPAPAAGASSAVPCLALEHPPQLGASIAPAAAYPSPVESPPSAPAAAPPAGESVDPNAGTSSSRGRRGTTLKRGREPEDENAKPAVDEERPLRRRRKVGSNRAVGV